MSDARAGLLLHGRGRPVEEMLQIAGRIGVPGIRWTAPRASDGQWYPHRFTGPVEANEPALTAAIEQCDSALRELIDRGNTSAEDAVVLGFSQGACLASEYVLRHPRSCRTLIMFTGGLIGPLDRVWQTEGGVSLAGLEVLITGSDSDQWVTAARVRQAADVLRSLGAAVDLHVYPNRDHLVSDDEIARARALIVKGVGSHF